MRRLTHLRAGSRAGGPRRVLLAGLACALLLSLPSPAAAGPFRQAPARVRPLLGPRAQGGLAAIKQGFHHGKARLAAAGRAVRYYGKARLQQLHGWAAEQRTKVSLRRARRELDRLGMPVQGKVQLHSDHRRRSQIYFKLARRELRRAGWQPRSIREHLGELARRAGARHDRRFKGAMGGFKQVPERVILLNADRLRGSAELASTLVHEGKHWSDHARVDALFDRGKALVDKHPTSRDELVAGQALLARLLREIDHVKKMAEPRAFGKQAQFLGRTGRRLGDLWIGPDPGPANYSPAPINAAIARNYLRGVRDALRPAMRRASDSGLQLAGAYLDGYRQVLRAQAENFGERPPAPRSFEPPAHQPGLLRRLGALLEDPLERLPGRAGRAAAAAVSLRLRRTDTVEAAFSAGWSDAVRGLSPLPGAGRVLVRR